MATLSEREARERLLAAVSAADALPRGTAFEKVKGARDRLRAELSSVQRTDGDELVKSATACAHRLNQRLSRMRKLGMDAPEPAAPEPAPEAPMKPEPAAPEPAPEAPMKPEPAAPGARCARARSCHEHSRHRESLVHADDRENAGPCRDVQIISTPGQHHKQC